MSLNLYTDVIDQRNENKKFKSRNSNNDTRPFDTTTKSVPNLAIENKTTSSPSKNKYIYDGIDYERLGSLKEKLYEKLKENLSVETTTMHPETITEIDVSILT